MKGSKPPLRIVCNMRSETILVFGKDIKYSETGSALVPFFTSKRRPDIYQRFKDADIKEEEYAYSVFRTMTQFKTVDKTFAVSEITLKLSDRFNKGYFTLTMFPPYNRSVEEGLPGMLYTTETTNDGRLVIFLAVKGRHIHTNLIDNRISWGYSILPHEEVDKIKEIDIPECGTIDCGMPASSDYTCKCAKFSYCSHDHQCAHFNATHRKECSFYK